MNYYLSSILHIIFIKNNLFYIYLTNNNTSIEYVYE